MNDDPSTRPKLTSLPADIVAPEDYERLAPHFLTPATFEHLRGGVGGEGALRENLAAFARLKIYNRVLARCAAGSTQVSLLGQSFRHPIFLAPVAHQALAHDDAEAATARAAEAMEACMIASTLSSLSLEAIAAAARGPKWFQLYFQPARAHTLDLLRRAEAAGYGAIVVTLDAPIQAGGRASARAGFAAPSTSANLAPRAQPPQVRLAPAQSAIFQGMMSEAPGWDDLAWLIGEARAPVLVKGITHPDDAARAVALGAAGVIVSNHGGRALDEAPASLAALPAIRAHLGQRACILLDGGVRGGSDVFKAIASGANAVLIGRLQIYALAVAGALGVAHLLKMLRDELEICMALAGCPTIADIGAAALFPAGAER